VSNDEYLQDNGRSDSSFLKLSFTVNESAKSGFQRVKRQFLPIRPVLAGAKVRVSFEGAKG